MTQRYIFITDKAVLKNLSILFELFIMCGPLFKFLSLPVEIHDLLRPKRLRH